MVSTLIEKLSIRINHDLPGKFAQEKMFIKPSNNKVKTGGQKKPAAVLILLYPNNEEWCFFLTKRTTIVEHHKGQISLPGGIIEQNESSKNAALRETHEEIGIKYDKINIIGSLTSYYVPISGFEIFPFLGWTEEKPKTKINNLEVARLISVSTNDLVLDKNYKIKNGMILGHPVKIPYFDLCGEMVWGATSVILSEFRFMLKEFL